MKNKNINLSVVLAVFNEERNLADCLNSIKNIADEIVIVDGGSTDNTLKIAESYNAIIIHTNNPPIFHINKQKAVDHAKGTWILQLDADEIITKELCFEIQALINSNNNIHNGYYIARKNFFGSQWMKKGGMWPDYVVRLFKKNFGKFPCKSVHEQIEIEGSIGFITNAIIHKPYPTFSEYLRKANTYTTLTKNEFVRDHLSINPVSFLRYSLIRPLKVFFSIYIRHKGFEDGFYGLIWAFFSALHYPWAFFKYLNN